MRAIDFYGNKRRAAWAVCLLAAACGCATRPPMLEMPAAPLVWPRDEAPARIAHIAVIRGEEDVAPWPGVVKRVTDAIFGAEPARGFRSPFGVAVSSSGIACVTDQAARAVHSFDIASREYRVWTDAGGGRAFHTPIGIAAVGESFAVADRGLGLVVMLASDGTPQGVIGETELEAPVGVAVGPLTGLLYVADVGLHAVKAFARDGRCAGTFGHRGSGDGEFNFPTFVACDAEERVYVADSLNARVHVFEAGGRFLFAWGGQGDDPGSFAQPKGIAVDRAGVVYVVDARFENVQMFDRRGHLLMAFGEEGTGPGQFSLPVGVCADDKGRIWVADSQNSRLQVFASLPAAEGGRAQ
jgi:DNA-binding beta-propeller fold protein YncE